MAHLVEIRIVCVLVIVCMAAKTIEGQPFKRDSRTVPHIQCHNECLGGYDMCHTVVTNMEQKHICLVTKIICTVSCKQKHGKQSKRHSKKTKPNHWKTLEPFDYHNYIYKHVNGHGLLLPYGYIQLLRNCSRFLNMYQWLIRRKKNLIENEMKIWQLEVLIRQSLYFFLYIFFRSYKIIIVYTSAEFHFKKIWQSFRFRFLIYVFFIIVYIFHRLQLTKGIIYLM